MMLQSRWATQVGERAKRLSRMMWSGRHLLSSNDQSTGLISGRPSSIVNQVGISRRCLRGPVPKQFTNHPERLAGANQIRREGVTEIVNPEVVDTSGLEQSGPRFPRLAHGVVSSPSDQPVAGGFVLLQLPDHPQGIDTERNLPVLSSVPLVSRRPDDPSVEVDLGPATRHDFVASGSREHQQLNQTGEAEVYPPGAFFPLEAQPEDAQPLPALHSAGVALWVVLNALAGVFVAPAPALGQGHGFTECFEASIRGRRSLVCCMPITKGRLVNFTQGPTREGSAKQMVSEVAVVVRPAPLAGFSPSLDVSASLGA